MSLEQLDIDDIDLQLFRELRNQGANVDQQAAAFEVKFQAVMTRFAGDPARQAELQAKKDALIAKLRATFGL